LEHNSRGSFAQTGCRLFEKNPQTLSPGAALLVCPEKGHQLNG